MEKHTLPNPLYEVAQQTPPFATATSATNPVYFKNLSLNALIENEATYDAIQQSELQQPQQHPQGSEEDFNHADNPMYDSSDWYDHPPSSQEVNTQFISFHSISFDVNYRRL